MDTIKKQNIGKLLSSERGLIFVEAAYDSEEDLKADGFAYAWSDKKLGHVFSKCRDDRGLYHSFALIEKGDF